jgi:septal ring factor EnvC (AmiA/AmiB activator)
VQKFGDPTDAGAATGLRYAPPSLATVTAPCTGRIDFAGPFRSYGQMLIVNCGHDDRFVLAGLGGIDVQIGQSVARGGQLGHMPAWSGEQNRPGLYVQLRHGGRTIDPGRFLQGR